MLKTIKYLLFAMVIMFSAAAFAHHSVSPHFDLSKEIILENAEVIEWKFANPHSYVFFKVTDQQGDNQEWRCEISAATSLRRSGWSADTIRPGQIVTIKGAPGRREANLCSLMSIKFADGTVLQRVRGQGVTKISNTTKAKEPTSDKQDRPLRLENGQPNISGNWISLSFGRNAKGGSPSPRNQGAPTWGGYTLTPTGLAAAENYDFRFDDPTLSCHLINIIYGWNKDTNVNQITQTDDTVTLQYGFVDFVRTIYLNKDSHPEDLTPSVGGHSIGKWEDDVLVVETIGFEPGVLLTKGGVHHGSELRIIERFQFDTESNELVRHYSMTDPEYFVGTNEGVDYMAISETPYTPYNCLNLSGKNNQRPN